MVWCGRISEGSLRQNGGGQFLHRLKGTGYATHASQPRVTDEFDPQREKVRDWSEAAAFYARDAAPMLLQLAEQLGVSYSSLADQGAGWCDYRRCWTFPERDGGGKVIGLLTRDLIGGKLQTKGSRRGLSFASSWRNGAGPIFLVEGASDVAALLTIGLSVVGRPSNTGGVTLLTDLLFDVMPNREIVVIGERDQKPNGSWPGKDGAISVAKQLADALERPIGWAFPPDDAKDSREWLQKMPKLPYDRLADLFVSGVETTLVDPPITISPEPLPATVLSIEQWRRDMLRARLASLAVPGVYLDRSPTGTGKSYVDLEAIRKLLGASA
jgi:hypothetical protein